MLYLAELVELDLKYQMEQRGQGLGYFFVVNDNWLMDDERKRVSRHLEILSPFTHN